MTINTLLEKYGSLTFSDDVMKERIPRSTYKAFHDSIAKGEPLSKETATVVANAMKIWAVENGATHYTHWFMPMTGMTAEKHDAFIEPSGSKAILEFSGKTLRKGEPDASSFPSGGLRATFEARGYTAWDCTSPAFIKDGSLYIPTLFCSYTGEALDKKTPLLRSCDALSLAATRLLTLIGLPDVTKVMSSVGAEQEYFLVDDSVFQQRLDLRLTGRTLFGAMAPKDQDIEAHYFGSLKRKVCSFMADLDRELWLYGIPAKTKHNEVAPAQHELACVYAKVNITTDNNTLLMQLMQEIAKKHGLRCLLHEKPFANVNGSGKHNNWSLITNTGINIFDPGENPSQNDAFLAALACTIKAVDEHADLLRMTIASAGNDHRLGGHEAPPAIISMFLGDALEELVENICQGTETNSKENDRFKTGVAVVPTFSKDTTDRNRTSPFAFTGNKFEFRAVGSNQSIAAPNTMLNAIVASAMNDMADALEAGQSLAEVVKRFIREHRRIIFNGDGYAPSWQEEAARRGLANVKNTVDAIECLRTPKNISLLTSLHIYSDTEIQSRYEILHENYIKVIRVEASTALSMVKTQINPAVVGYLRKITETYLVTKEANIETCLKDDVTQVSSLLTTMKEQIKQLEQYIDNANQMQGKTYEISMYWRTYVLETMQQLRQTVDSLEEIVDRKDWPMPTYIDLLFGI